MVKSQILDRTFAALSDPARGDILDQLTHGPASISELASARGMPAPGVIFTSTTFKADTAGATTREVTVTFEERDGKTLLTILQTGFENDEERDMIQNGWPTILDRLDNLVGSRR